MQFFIAAYALAFLLWRAEDGRHPAILLFSVLVVSVWLVLYMRHRDRRHLH